MALINKSIFTSNLNNTGIFFELAVLKFVNGYKPFCVETQVPYTLAWEGMPPINGVMDFLCLCLDPNYPLVYFIIECKKADPGLKNWIFFKRNKDEEESTMFYRDNTSASPKFKFKEPFYDDVCDRGIQIVGSKKTRAFYDQKKDPIYNAAIQANAGLKKMIYNDKCFTEMQQSYGRNDRIIYYFPIVITTANLYICDANTDDINIITGEANLDEIKYELKEWVEYSVPIPEYLQVRGADRRSTFIVNSQHLENFFNNIIKRLRFVSNAHN